MTGIGTPNAIVMCRQPIPDRGLLKNGMRLQVVIPDAYAVVGDEYRLYVCCDHYESPETGVMIAYTKVGDNSWEVTINDDETTTVTNGKLPGDTILYVCADHHARHVKAGILTSPDEPAWWDQDPGDGRYYGIGHNNTEHTNYFDDFEAKEMRRPGEVCNDCFCWCDLYVPRRALKATIFNATRRASCLEGHEWNMDWEWDVGLQPWTGNHDFPHFGGAGSTNVAWRLVCGLGAPEYPGGNFGLGAATACQFGASTLQASPLSTCDPLSLIFGPYTLYRSDLSCSICFPPFSTEALNGPGAEETSGTFYIAITERV